MVPCGVATSFLPLLKRAAREDVVLKLVSHKPILPFPFRNLTALRTLALILMTITVADARTVAQDAVAPSRSDRDTVNALLQRVEELETTIQALKGQVRDLQMKQSSAAVTTLGTAATAVVADSLPQQAAVQEQLGIDRFSIHLRGFGHVGFSATDERRTHGAYALGDLDLLLTSRISSTAGVLSEILFEPEDAGSFTVDVERFLLQFNQNDHFNVGLGRFHTGIGFYNSYFHHGNYMQTTTDRPLMFAFADDGGILPTGTVGITVSGKLPSGRLGLAYLAEFGSQDTRRTTFNHTDVDLENGNSTNFGIVSRPQVWPGVQAGFSFYHDGVKPYGLQINENILAAHLVIRRPSFEWLNEGLVIRHAPVGSPVLFNTPGFYSQVSYRFGAYRPYFRYQYVNASDNEPVLGDVRRREGPSAGVRYDFHESAAIKLQYDRQLIRNQPAVNGITGQVAFTF